jgi:hypothetical protein
MRDTMQQRFAEIMGNAELSDVGRLARRTDAVKATAPKITSRLDVLAKRRKEIDAEASAIQTERRPVAATEFEKQQALTAWTMAEDAARRGDKLTAERIRATFRDPNPDGPTHRLQAGFAALHPALVGLVGQQYQSLLAVRHAEDVGPRGQQLAEEAQAIDDEREQLLQLRAQLVKQADREALERDGIVEVPATRWTSEQRADFIRQHGDAAYREKLNDAMREALTSEPPRFSGMSFQDAPEPPKAA